MLILIFRHSFRLKVWIGMDLVPPTNGPLLPTKLVELRALYDPLSCSDNFGVNLYFDVLQFVQNNIRITSSTL